MGGPKIKILIIRFSSIGDVVLTSPVIRCLHHQKNTEIHFLIKKDFLPALGAHPFIAKIHVLEGQLFSLLEVLRAERYDYIIDLHGNMRSWIVKNILGRPSFTYDKLRFSRWLRTKGYLKTKTDKHIADRYLDTLGPLGISDDHGGLDFYIDPKDQYPLPPRMSYRKRVAIVPGAQHYTKRIPIGLLAKLIKSKPYIQYYVLGGAQEQELGRKLEAGNAQNLCGKINLQQSASVISQIDFVISGDTGLMHIAAALDKSMIVLWGSTVKEFGFYPYYKSSANTYINIERENLSCRPCTRIGKSRCPQGHFKCMTEISTSEVLLAMNKLEGLNHSVEHVVRKE